MIKVRCPICDRIMQSAGTKEWRDYPFCSSRCRMIDLGRWLGGGYVIPPEDEPDPPAESSDERYVS